jgi:hypothetical protein
MGMNLPTLSILLVDRLTNISPNHPENLSWSKEKAGIKMTHFGPDPYWVSVDKHTLPVDRITKKGRKEEKKKNEEKKSWRKKEKKIIS